MSLVRNVFLLLPLAVLTACAEPDPPNVIVIVTDDQGYGDMSVHGNPELNTPELDRLAHEGVRLEDFHVDPTCSPTRAALMTGRYSARVGVWLTYAGRNHQRADELTMADVFRFNGYRTAIFGKWHLGDNLPFRPQDRGFDESLIHGGGVAGETPDVWGNNYFEDIYFRNGKPEPVQGYSTDVWFNEASRYIEANAEAPFFIYLASNTPHNPFNVPQSYSQPFLDAGIEEPRARFYGMIRNIDENIGRLRAHLEALGLTRDTIILFMTDNGTTAGYTGDRDGWPSSGYNAGMRGRKGSVYEGGHRAAMFINWPGGNLADGLVVDGLAAHIDVLPTLIELVDLELPRSVVFDGASLASDLRGHVVPQADRALVVHNQARFGEPVGEGRMIKYKDYAVMTERWRMVGPALYEIEADPGQHTDVADNYPEVVADLTLAYESWWDDVSVGSDRHVPTVIDPARQREVMLTAQSWHGDTIPYNQQHVRAGVTGTGYWAIDVRKPGRYQVELRRWPRELDLAMGSSVPAPDLPDGADPKFELYVLRSNALEAKSAGLIAGQQSLTQSVASADTAAVFRFDLESGVQILEAWFDSPDGESWGPYYVYIEPSNSPR